MRCAHKWPLVVEVFSSCVLILSCGTTHGYPRRTRTWWCKIRWCSEVDLQQSSARHFSVVAVRWAETGTGRRIGNPTLGDPCSFFGQHGALKAVEGRFDLGERLFAFLDDIYLLCHPERVKDVHDMFKEELRTRVGIRVRYGTTQVWNMSGQTLRGVDTMTPQVRMTVKDAVVWRGDRCFPVDTQGVGSALHRSSGARQETTVKEDVRAPSAG